MPEHTMGGLLVHDDGNLNGTLHQRVLRVVLTSRFPDLFGPISDAVATAFDQDIKRGSAGADGWISVPSWAAAKRVITAANVRVFFGDELADNAAFHAAVLSFVDDLLLTAEILRLTPSFIRSFIAPLLMKNYRESQTIIKYLTPVVEERLVQSRLARAEKRPHLNDPVDCIQFFIDANSRKLEWTAQRIVQVLLGVWFASVHQPALTLVYALENLCEHPEYIDLLRQELSTCLSDSSDSTEGVVNESAASLEDTALLDAFLKESSRLRPSDSISVRRKVMKPFTFIDGTHIPAGDVVCVPMNAILRDPTRYADSGTFYPWRFVGQKSQNEEEKGIRGVTSKFTDMEYSYPLWGLGGYSW